MKRLAIILFSVLTLGSIQTKASHLLGGEITWECITSGNDEGKLIFTLKLYRACTGVNLGSSYSINNPLYASNGGAASITVSQSEANDISPKCFADTAEMNCYISGRNGNAIEEKVYVSSAVSVYGTPATGGSAFWMSSCCRPAASLMRNINGSGYWLRAVMFPYTDPASGNTLSLGSTSNGPTCYDSSPKFAEKPATIICTGYEFTYNHNATDEELDSLSYSWTPPMQTSSSSVTWRAGYSVVNQLPTSYHNSNNVAPTLNSLTGEIKFTAFSPQGGYHSTAVKVTSYKCRQKVAEVYRDIPVVLLACPPTPTIPPLANTPPNVNFKWSASSSTNLTLPAGDTVMAGDSVNFYLTSIDIQFLPGFIGQTNFLLPSGSQFGAKFADTANGCKYPPCAILDTNNTYWNDSALWWEGEYGLQTRFSWKTDCNHLAQVNACFTKSNTYNFVFKVLDDWCPAPGMNFQTFSVTVLAPPALEPPKFTCSEVKSNGDVVLRWSKPVTKAEDTLNSFRKYLIKRAVDTAGAPFDTIHIVQDIDSLVWVDQGANTINGLAKFYIIHGISSCNDQGDSVLSDTISGMKLEASVYNSGNGVALEWTDFNFQNRWGQNTTGEYYIWQVVGSDTTLIDTTTESWDSLSINMCDPTYPRYFVTVVDTSSPWGCTSRSNVVGDSPTMRVGDNIPPNPVQLDSVSYDLNNVIQLGWTPSAPDIGMYYIWIYNGSSYIRYDSVPRGVLNYTYTPGVSDSCIMNFKISARDTCMNMGDKNTTIYEQNSMCAKVTKAERCMLNPFVEFEWNLYNNWLNGRGSQEIWRSDNGGPWTMIDTVNALDQSYRDTSVYGATTFCYRVLSTEKGSGRTNWSSNVCYYLDTLIDSTIIDAPDLRCISWVNDSTLRLQWNKPLNPGRNFHAYQIYYSNIGGIGTFMPLDSVRGPFKSDNKAWDSLGYTYLNADTSMDHYFQVYAQSGCYGTDLSPASSITLQAIDVEVTPVNDSTNRLEWNPAVGNPTNYRPDYLVYRDANNVGNPLYGSELFNDVHVACNDDVIFTVEYGDGGVWIDENGVQRGCVSRSREIPGNFTDDTPPAKQFVDSVSFIRDTNRLALVGWSANPSKDVVQYYVMHCVPGAYSMLDTISSTSPFYFEDLNNAPLDLATSYTVTAEDSCGNNNLSSGDFNCHTTLWLDPIMDFCDQSIKLGWNAYDDFASGTGVEYVIYVSENNGPFNEIGRTDEPKFKHEDIVNGNNYCYYVSAWENGGVGPFSASSFVTCLDAEFIIKPAYAYLKYVTVDDTNVIRMAMDVDLNSNIGEYWVNRSNSKDEGFQLIGTIPIPDPITPADSTFYYQDLEVETHKRSYYYRIDVVDPCGEVGRSSNLGRSILLDVSADNERSKNVLTFNIYEDFEGKVREYEVYRGTSPSTMIKVKPIVMNNIDDTDDVTMDGDKITYIDDVSGQGENGDGMFCYQVVALEGTSTFQNKEPQVSKSNIACSIQYPNFYAPSGFTPNGDGLNDVFRPQGSFHDATGYSMEVYNRWGEMIYKTDNYEAGWDGTYGGNLSPAGAYVFIVRYTSADGVSYEERGTVTLTR